MQSTVTLSALTLDERTIDYAGAFNKSTQNRSHGENSDRSHTEDLNCSCRENLGPNWADNGCVLHVKFYCINSSKAMQEQE